MKRTLFIFSDDFGELVLLRLLMYNQPVNATALMPEHMLPYITLPNVEKFAYRNADDLKRYIDDIMPEQILFFSAYILATNNLISTPEFYSLMDYLDEKKIEISTSDPFIRYYDQVDFDLQAKDFLSNARNAFKEIGERLAGYRHLYPIPVQPGSTPHQSFSNHFRKNTLKQAHDKKQWTFVMAMHDYRLLQFEGQLIYHKTVVPLFTSLANDYNISVNLVLPEEFYKILKRELKDVSGINYINYCSIDAFEDLIIQSDVMIYWNLFSASTLLCRLYNKPTVFLSKGHMETIFPGFLNYIRPSWFPEKEPGIMKINDSLIPDIIKKIEAEEAGTNEPMLFQPYFDLDSPLTVLNSMSLS
ncbi:hypothetical protein F0919_14380 [Taibaiella lutea]|uniref:Uncharacterized protein n=1 Tax=Taibaiella lutea TaxID=2608001 RepID=A0A5M6CF95_9BACT|nr:hypothetical protein [Taibaiella lutea]KAA5533716.1 hypothetical protein F0919_14380 [Taibaiella lutea]